MLEWHSGQATHRHDTRKGNYGEKTPPQRMTRGTTTLRMLSIKKRLWKPRRVGMKSPVNSTWRRIWASCGTWQKLSTRTQEQGAAERSLRKMASTMRGRWPQTSWQTFSMRKHNKIVQQTYPGSPQRSKTETWAAVSPTLDDISLHVERTKHSNQEAENQKRSWKRRYHQWNDQELRTFSKK